MRWGSSEHLNRRKTDSAVTRRRASLLSECSSPPMSLGGVDALCQGQSRLLPPRGCLHIFVKCLLCAWHHSGYLGDFRRVECHPCLASVASVTRLQGLKAWLMGHMVLETCSFCLSVSPPWLSQKMGWERVSYAQKKLFGNSAVPFVQMTL